MKKYIISLFLLCSLATQLYAGDDFKTIENMSHNVEDKHSDHGAFYIIIKGLLISGDTVPHGHAILDGDRGHGFGVDLGYMFGNGFALEYDFSYAKNTVTETDEHHHSEDGDGKYYTHALNLVYAYHVSHTVGIFLKAGYEYEKEEIDDFHIDSSDTGFIYALGIEVTINDHYRFVVEGEKSTIDGPRGAALFAGVMYIF